MRILWVNSSTTETNSNTRLFGIPPIFEEMGHTSSCLVAGRPSAALPEYFITLPMLFGRFGLYRFLATVALPFLCMKHRPDVIITDWMSAVLTRFVVILKKIGFLKVKLIHDVRTVPVKDDGGKSYSVYTKSLKYAKANFDGITTITKPLREKICAEFDYFPDQIAIWTSGVDTNHFQPRDASELRQELNLNGKFVVFYHGSVNQNRGVVRLAEAAEYLRNYPEVRILIVGSGNQWNRLQSVIKRKNLDQVILKQTVPYAEIPRWISLADLCVVPLPDHPWWRVSSPLKLMEYLSMGKPVLLTEMIAHRAIIPSGDDAFYVEDASPKAFAEGIKRAIKAKDKLKQMGEWGRRKADSELTWRDQASVLINYIYAVLEGKVNIRRSKE